jgi:hypothetical protein
MKKIGVTKLLAVISLTIGIGSLYTSLSYAVYNGTITDNFNGATINTHLWRPFHDFPQQRVAQQEGELRIQIDGTSVGDEFGAGLKSKFLLKGNFEMIVDYRCITWPEANGVRLGFEGPGKALPQGIVMVKRVSFGPDEPSPDPEHKENYFAIFSDDGQVWDPYIEPTTDNHGGLKLTRVGSLLTGYFMQGNDWVLIGSHSYPDIGPDAWIEITLWANSRGEVFRGQNVEIAFDNFQVSYDQVRFLSDLSPITLLLLE